VKEQGKLIVVEGPDGAGKSTLISGLQNHLLGSGIEAEKIREPGGTALSEQIRLLLKGLTAPDTEIDPRAETLLFAAARAQLCAELIGPLLRAGKWVLLDRFEGSTIVYQGIARGLGRREVEEISIFARGDVVPDLVLVLDLSIATSLRRMNERDSGQPDRMEQATRENLEEIINGYRSLAEHDPWLYRIISAEGSPEEVLHLAVSELATLSR
jgi:dTMP kinase